MVKFLDRGTGSARAAADYLTADLDAKGKEREQVQVLRGDPHQVADVADSLEFENKYTAGLFAWAPEDQPNDWQIDRVLEEFEKTAWAGLEPDRYAWSAVQHRDARGGVHVHVLAARVRPGERQEPEYRAARLGEDLWGVTRLAESRKQLEPAGRSVPRAAAAAGPSRLHRGGAAEGGVGCGD